MSEEPRVRTVRLIPAERHTRKSYVAAYVRVSSKKGNQEESYEAQAVYYENLIRSNPEWDFAGVYGDRQSGTRSDNRAEFQRMIHAEKRENEVYQYLSCNGCVRRKKTARAIRIHRKANGSCAAKAGMQWQGSS